MFYLRIIDALTKAKIPYAVVGGYAVALHGAVRGTVDLDLVIRLTERDLARVEKELQRLGLQSRLPLKASEVFRFREEYIHNRNLTAWSFVNPDRPIEIVDILLTEDLKRVKVRSVKVGPRTVRVASIGDLIRMKRSSSRPQDLEDIKALRSFR